MNTVVGTICNLSLPHLPKIMTQTLLFMSKWLGHKIWLIPWLAGNLFDSFYSTSATWLVTSLQFCGSIFSHSSWWIFSSDSPRILWATRTPASCFLPQLIVESAFYWQVMLLQCITEPLAGHGSPCKGTMATISEDQSIVLTVGSMVAHRQTLWLVSVQIRRQQEQRH